MKNKKNTGHRKEHLKKNLDKIRDVGPAPWQYLLSIGVFVAGIVLLFGVLGSTANDWLFIVYLALAVPVLAVLIEVIQGHVRFGLLSIVKAYLGHTIKLTMELLLLCLSLPVIVLIALTRPATAMVFFVSLAVLVVYTIESLLGFDIKGMSADMTNLEALVCLGAFVVSSASFLVWSRVDNLIDWIVGKMADVYAFVLRLLLDFTGVEPDQQT